MLHCRVRSSSRREGKETRLVKGGVMTSQSMTIQIFCSTRTCQGTHKSHGLFYPAHRAVMCCVPRQEGSGRFCIPNLCENSLYKAHTLFPCTSRYSYLHVCKVSVKHYLITTAALRATLHSLYTGVIVYTRCRSRYIHSDFFALINY